MFGVTKKKQTDKERIKELERILAQKEAFERSLIVEKRFWQDYSVQLANSVMSMYQRERELVVAMAESRNDVDLKAYAEAIGREIEANKPDPAVIAGMLAMQRGNTQGVMTASPKRESLRVINEGAKFSGLTEEPLL